MGQRGKTSQAQLAVASPHELVPRAAAPRDLTSDQRTVWIAVVNSLPAEWFPPETLPLLVQYCRHIVQSRGLEGMIQSFEKRDDFDIETYDRLLKMRERESRAIMSLATKMRLSQSTQHTARKGKGRQTSVSKPWQTDLTE